MKTLIRTEWLKMRKYNAFWWIMGITTIAYPGIIYIFYFAYKELISKPNEAGQLMKMAIGNPFSFPETWHTITYASSIFVFIPAVVIIMFITNEYSYKTHRQNIIDGWSRNQFITSKLADVLIITLIITTLCFIISLIVGFANQERLIRDTWSQSYYIGLFALQTFSQLSIAFLIGFLIRKAFIALGVFLGYYILAENIMVGLSYKYLNDIGRFLPLEMSDRMIPPPAFWGRIDPEVYKKALDHIPQFVILTTLLTSLIWFICYRINNKRDLK